MLCPDLAPTQVSCWAEAESIHPSGFPGRGWSRIVHGMAEKSCRKVFQLFCFPDYNLYEKLPGYPGGNPQIVECQHTQTWLSPPPTLLIVNISNSTLNNCIIGNGINPPNVAEGLGTCNCRTGQQVAAQIISRPPLPRPSTEPTYINISDSDLKWVIIGNNNTMCTQ